MKLNKKKVVVVSLAISLIAILSFGTLAWFNATSEVTNKFYVADSEEPDAKPEFSVSVTENKTDAEGKNYVDEDEDGVYDITDEGNTYENVVPGDVIVKNPVVKNTGKYDQWVRVQISISKDFADQVAEAQNTSAANIDFTELFGGFNSAAFEANRVIANVYTDYYTYVYYVAAPLAPEGTVPVFTAVNIPTSFTQEDMAYGLDGFQIIVKAEAVQADNITGPASAAFTTVGWDAGETYEQSQSN